jgi:hypothetical protein
MLEFDAARVERNVRSADTRDLLDRVTAYRAGMEPVALAMIEAELDRRGVDATAIRRHAEEETATVLLRPEGFAFRCDFCPRPAVERRWAWHRLWGVLPVFPRVFYYCRQHAGVG